MVASCESYLLIGCGFSQLEGLILLNPTTRIYRVLPKVQVPTWSNSVYYGMCHCLDDELNGDFKIVRFVQENGTTEVIVYSLRTNSWKLLESEKATIESIWNPVLVQNNLLVRICNGSGQMKRIGCFDIKAERWSNDVVLPDIILCEIDSNQTRDGQYYLGVLDGRLCISCYNADKSTYSVWVMKEYGIKESWFKLMSLHVEGPEEIYHPIAYRKGSSHELLCLPNYSGKYFWYNIKDKQFTETGINRHGLETGYLSFAYICKQSLLNFPGGLLIRSSPKVREVDDDNDDYDSDYDDGYYYSYGNCL
ncbi:F-box protein CPR1-like [Silene latifolia]|uniref:F-box protein CPR1-like n=1 Tax=Silene latifolia TaxID=37657 RepID=UPI003D76E0A4